MEIQSHTGLRGIAATLVFIFHLYQDLLAPKYWFLGIYAVDLFFILSGFILNWVYLSKNNKINWQSYSMARVARILPLYYLTTIAAIPLIYHSFLSKNTYSIFFDILSNALLVTAVFNKFIFNGPAWSISVEWFCYFIIFPALVLIRSKLLNNRYGVFISAVLVVTLMRLFIICYRGGLSQGFDIFWMKALEKGIVCFAMGFFICFLFEKINLNKWPRVFFEVSIFLLLIVICMGCFRIIPPHIILYAFPFLIFLTAYGKGYVVKFLENPIAQWLGTRSYSIYLWHWLLIEYTSSVRNNLNIVIYSVGILVLVALVSELSFRYFEMPLRDKIRFIFAKKPLPA